MSLADAQEKTAKAFIDGYNEWSVEGLLRARSDDCVHAMLPASLGRPERTNADYEKFFGTLQGLMSEFKMTISKIVNAPEQHMAVIHATGSGETPVGPYRNEYAWFMTFTEDGSKVQRVEEFVDSAFSNGFFAKVQEFVKAQQQQQGKQ